MEVCVVEWFPVLVFILHVEFGILKDVLIGCALVCLLQRGCSVLFVVYLLVC